MISTFHAYPFTDENKQHTILVHAGAGSVGVVRLLGENGKVDVVLNSVASNCIDKSVELLRIGGHFLEIGKRGILSQDQMLARRSAVLSLVREEDMDEGAKLMDEGIPIRHL